MTLLWIALLPLLGVLVPALTAQRGRTWCSLATAYCQQQHCYLRCCKYLP